MKIIMDPRRFVRHLAVLPLLAALTGCLSLGGRKPAPPPEPETWPLTVEVTTGTPPQPVTGVTLTVLDGPNAGVLLGRTSDAIVGASRVTFDSLHPGGFTICADAEGFHRKCEGLVLVEPTTLTFSLEPVVVAPPPPPPAKGRPGRVTTVRHAFADGKGVFDPLGVSLFWGPWGYREDRARLARNLEDIQTLTGDYVRVLGQVGPAGWRNRTINVRWPDYDAVIAGFTDLAYDVYGIRTQWTIFGSIEQTPTQAERIALVNRFIRMSKGREHKIFAWEVVNEGWQNFVPGDAGLEEMRALARLLQKETGILTTLSAPKAGTECAVYAGSSADFAAMHYERSEKADGLWRPVRQPWGYPDEYDQRCEDDLPAVVSNNEPIGPQSSVNTDGDPLRLAMARAATHVANNGAYVFHSGPGVRGGGTEDLNVGRAANLRDMPGFAAIARAFAASQAYLPADLANWTRHNAQWSSAPIRGYDTLVDNGTIIRAYAATKGSRVLVLILGAKGPVTGTASRAMTLYALNPATGALLKTFTLAAGERFTIEGLSGYVLTTDKPGSL